MMQIERGLVKTASGYIHYRAAGRGKPIMLLHINQQSSALYLELIAVLGGGPASHCHRLPQLRDVGPCHRTTDDCRLRTLRD